MERKIHKLSTEVINQIAAGEVIHRPENALKELLENAIDSGASQLSVTVNQGGLKLLQIQDNGHGIRTEDLRIVCERFTTSKLRTFDDLLHMQTFGFRGEALASISHVSHLTIISKTASQKCAYKAHYRDGKLIGPRPGASSDPKPCAGKNGTQIIVEDLFYNLRTRKEALKNTAEQYRRILDVVQKYAIHFGSTGKSFICKKHRSNTSDVLTKNGASKLDNIAAIYGQNLSRELLPFQCNLTGEIVCEANGYVSNANYNMKKSTFILFINNRLVENSHMKRSIEDVYSEFLPKHTHPYIYLSITLPSQNLDVNVHPTKKEVHFLHQEEIIQEITASINKLLRNGNDSRTFFIQPIANFATTLPDSESAINSVSSDDSENVVISKCDTKSSSDSFLDINNSSSDIDSDEGETSPPIVEKVKVLTQEEERKKKNKLKNQNKKPAQRLVRTDPSSNTLDRFCYLESQDVDSQIEPGSESSSPKANSSCTDAKCDSENSSTGINQPKRKRDFGDDNEQTDLEEDSMFTSISNLLDSIQFNQNKSIKKMLQEHSFVGTVNDELSLIQWRTKLYVIRHCELMKNFFYEQVIKKFSKLPVIKLSSPLPLDKLSVFALDGAESGYSPEDGPKDTLALEITELLVSHAAMLEEYFSIVFDSQNKTIVGVPRIWSNHQPTMEYLPEFILQLATEVNWEEEEECFKNVAIELSSWYCRIKPKTIEQHNQILQHVIYPAFKTKNFTPPLSVNNSSIIMEVACLKNLYKIFERC